jgi:hypothetical protein
MFVGAKTNMAGFRDVRSVTTKTITTLFLSAALICCGAAAHASEAEFLKTLDGGWNGDGKIKVRVNSFPISITCRLTSRVSGTSLSLIGKCTSFLGFSRVIGAVIVTDGSTYSGTYVGAGTGVAVLNGKRSGNAIKLAVHWAKEVNGDRSARMTIEKIGSDGMSLTTVDTDPKTGKEVVTSQIDLRRASSPLR